MFSPADYHRMAAFGVAVFQVDWNDGRRVIETDAGGIDVTVFPGPEPRDVVRRFTQRVGRSPLPPLWALGHHQSRWSYASEREVRELAASGSWQVDFPDMPAHARAVSQMPRAGTPMMPNARVQVVWSGGRR